jgi:hypothetical protein
MGDAFDAPAMSRLKERLRGGDDLVRGVIA